MNGYVFMHTIDGKPATFDGEQICFANPRRPLDLVENIAIIKAHQKASNIYRKKQGFSTLGGYGWHRVAKVAKTQPKTS